MYIPMRGEQANHIQRVEQTIWVCGGGGSQWLGDDHKGWWAVAGCRKDLMYNVRRQQYLNKIKVEHGLRVFIKVPKEVGNGELILNASTMLGFFLDANTTAISVFTID